MKPHILSLNLVLLVMLTLCGAVFSDFAFAESRITQYSAATLEKAQMQDAVSVIQFNASWCSTCVRQATSLASLSTDARFASISFFQADYDSSDQLKEQLGVSRQSTVLVFKGKKEVARVAGVTDESALASLISKVQM